MSEDQIAKLLQDALSDSGQKVDLYNEFEKKAVAYGMTLTQARKLLGIERKSLIPLLKGEAKQPNLINVLKIAEFLELDPSEVIKCILANQQTSNFAKIEEAKSISFLAKSFDIGKLQKEKFLKNKDAKYVSERMLSFFGFSSIYEFEEYNNQLSAILFSQTKRKFTDKMRDFAVKSAYRLFELIDNPNTYERDELKELIPKIKPYTRDVRNGLREVIRALYAVGVTVVFQEHLTTSQYRGATYAVNGKPCIVITDLNKKYPTIWFALLHELYHVLFDFDNIQRSIYHLTGQSDLFLLNEQAADEFAREYFFGSDEYYYLKPHIHSEYLVDKFAKENNVHPSFIYSHFQYFISKNEGGDYWRAFKKHFPSIEETVANLSPLTWRDDHTLQEVAIDLKKAFNLQLTS